MNDLEAIRQTIQKRLLQLEQERLRLNAALEALAGSPPRPDTSKPAECLVTSDTKAGIPNLREAVYDVVATAGRFIHVHDIEEALRGDMDESDIRIRRRKLSQALYAKSRAKDSDLVSIQQGDSKTSFYWGLKPWLEADGKTIKPEHNVLQEDRPPVKNDKGPP